MALTPGTAIPLMAHSPVGLHQSCTYRPENHRNRVSGARLDAAWALYFTRDNALGLDVLLAVRERAIKVEEDGLITI